MGSEARQNVSHKCLGSIAKRSHSYPLASLFRSGDGDGYRFRVVGASGEPDLGVGLLFGGGHILPGFVGPHLGAAAALPGRDGSGFHQPRLGSWLFRHGGGERSLGLRLADFSDWFAGLFGNEGACEREIGTFAADSIIAWRRCHPKSSAHPIAAEASKGGRFTTGRPSSCHNRSGPLRRARRDA